MKKILCALALCGALTAHATCGFTGNPAIDNNCATPSTPATQPSAQAAAAAAAAARAAAIGQGGGGGGGGAGGAAAQRQQATGGSVQVQGALPFSGDTYTSNAVAYPSLPNLPPVIIPGAQSTSVFIPCGPLLAKWPQPITVHYHDLTDHEVRYQGVTWDLGMAKDYGGDNIYVDAQGIAWGNSALVIHTVISTGSTRQISLGGGDGKSWGQGGMGSGGANQQLVKDVTILPCQLPVKTATSVVAPVAKRPAMRRAPAKPPCKAVTRRICVPA